MVGREVAAGGSGHISVAGDVPVARVLDRAPHLQPWKGKPHEIIYLMDKATALHMRRSNKQFIYRYIGKLKFRFNS